MKIAIFDTKEELGEAAARYAAEAIRSAIDARGASNIVLATGASQFDTLAHLVCEEGIDWARVTMFHLDEYVGLPADHPASFRRYLAERFVRKVGHLAAAHFVNGDAPDPQAECRRLGELIAGRPIDVALVGIGENGHLAFNDPPADFDTDEAYIVVRLDEACRRQQLGEGWFEKLRDVPARAISMSVRQVMKAARLVCSVPDLRKADAVKRVVEGEVTSLCPASILKRHPDCLLLLDRASASKLSRPPA